MIEYLEKQVESVEVKVRKYSKWFIIILLVSVILLFFPNTNDLLFDSYPGLNWVIPSVLSFILGGMVAYSNRLGELKERLEIEKNIKNIRHS